MFQGIIRPINAEELPAEEFQFVKAQVAIGNLCSAIEQDEAFKAQLASAETPQNFLQIASENGYEFSVSDLEDTLRLALEQPEFNFDEFDDYELSEDELEMVAGGTAFRMAVQRTSYWHDTGIQFDNKCFYLDAQGLERRSEVVKLLKFMEKAEFKGNGEIEFLDTNGQHEGAASITMKGFVYGSSPSTRSVDLLDASWEIL